jgi:hypothetical protein
VIAGTGAEPQTAPAAPSMPRICAESIRFLHDVYSEELALFPYSSTAAEGREWVNDYGGRWAVRYSINSLLGLKAAADAGLVGGSGPDVPALLDAFVDRHGRSLDNPADHGLLLVLLAGLDRHRDAAGELLRRVERLARDTAVAQLNMQDLGWMLWGATAAAREGLGGAAETATRLHDTIVDDFVDPRTALPRHSVRRYRRDIVSFGSISYYLRSLHEYARFSGEGRARALFGNGVERILALQGPAGEWPWLLNARTGRIIDPYPVFTVHQDSMALLFLLPALENEGLPGAAEAIARSLAWVAGANELGIPMLEDEPFRAFRAIERREHVPRLRRYVRAAQSAAGRRGGWPDRGGDIRLNPECRSYHVGWLLYVWAGRGEAVVPGRAPH